MRSTFHYTAHKDPIIDDVIQQHMEIIVEEILKVIEGVDSIVLSGGFGRGEGSIIVLPQGGISPMNDYDIYVFSDAKVCRESLNSLIDNIHHRIGVKHVQTNNITPLIFHVGIQIVRTSKLNRLNPDMSTYGLKTASKVLYGKDLRNKILVKEEDIPLGAGINPLFLATLGLIENLKPEYIKSEVSERETSRFNYECYKVYIAISTALSFLAGLLELSHEKRARLVYKIYADEFPELAIKCPDIPKKVEHYTNLKLRSLSFREEKDPVKLWFEAKRDLEYVLWYCQSKVLGYNTIDDVPNFISTNAKSVDFYFFEGYLTYLLKSKGFPNIRTLIKMLMPAVRLVLNINYAYSYYKLNGKLFPKPIFCPVSCLICIYLAGVLLLSSICAKESPPKYTHLKKASEFLHFLSSCRLPKGNEWTIWRTLRDTCIRSYNILNRGEKITF